MAFEQRQLHQPLQVGQQLRHAGLAEPQGFGAALEVAQLGQLHQHLQMAQPRLGLKAVEQDAGAGRGHGRDKQSLSQGPIFDPGAGWADHNRADNDPSETTPMPASPVLRRRWRAVAASFLAASHSEANG